MIRRRPKPWQYGLASLFWLMTAVAFAVWLDVPYFLHLGSVLIQILWAMAGVSLVGALVLAPFAVFSLIKWLVEESNWEALVDRVRSFEVRRKPSRTLRHEPSAVERGAVSDPPRDKL